MARCELTGKGPTVKNLVSHSNIKTKSRAFPNIQRKRFFSCQLGKHIRLKVAVSALRDIDKAGDFDVFVSRQADKNLSPRALEIKREIRKKTSRPGGVPDSAENTPKKEKANETKN